MQLGWFEYKNTRGPSPAAIVGFVLALSAVAPGVEPVRDVNEPVSIKRVLSGRSVRVFVVNRAAYDVTVGLTLQTRNGHVQWFKPETETYGPYSETEAARISAADPGKRYTWRCRFKWARGSMHAEYDPNTVYRLPFKRGASHRVIQGYNGRLTHQGRDKYAVDFAMREGTSVCAARAGVVVDIRESSKVGGPRKSFRDHANFVSIAHPDGTIAEYYHLKYNGVEVEIGQKVTAGQVIALSGDTGYSTSPHLHFGVYSALDAENLQSYPVTFTTTEGKIDKPVERRLYTAK